ncbi:hypothetical protein MLD38_003316 [Melastoma candidum]|uniref:Uncharacterized protein n=1 Tax=Melastoma candidum TaxID=119954 RepID=A0ACB9S2F1_9MYRT|nr:hypothetical protein MLD38_003316 [Melastoma candidum]
MKSVEMAPSLRIFFPLVLLSVSFPVAVSELAFDVGQSASLQLSPGILVENSPGARPGSSMFCQRVGIHGLSRISNISMLAHSVKLKVLSKPGTLKPTKFEVCFHRNASVADCMCPEGQWEKVGKGIWSQWISPFDNKFLDLRVVGSSLEGFVVEAEEELFQYRIVLLVLGLVLLTFAPLLSKSLIFYYSSAMAVGIILVILIVLFQGMRLLPTGRRNSLAIFLYSSFIGLGSFLFRYVPRLIRSLLVEMGISEEMYNPIAIFLVTFLVLVGAWMGFWVVRKLVLTEDGLVDTGTSYLVAWSLRFLAAAMILQCSLDLIVSTEVLLLGIALSWSLKKLARLNYSSCRTYLSSIGFILMFWKHCYWKTSKSQHERGSVATPSQLSNSDSYYSTFHTTPEKRRFSDDEWRKFTKDFTKRSLEDLVSSPDFSRWAVAHADRITLAQPVNDGVSTSFTGRLRRWVAWS